jgi:hypothetical protein
LTRRQLLRVAAAAAAAWNVGPWLIRPPTGIAQVAVDDPLIVPTLEAFADTLIPGEKRAANDRAIAGAAAGAGAVQAGAVDLLRFGPAGTAEVVPAVAAGLNVRAIQYAAQHGIVIDPTVPPLVALDFVARTELLVQILDGTDPDQLAFFAIAALVFLAYHTAGHLHLADAVRNGHPGLAAIGFPQPDADDVWRFREFSYRRALARNHPRTSKRGNPA